MQLLFWGGRREFDSTSCHDAAEGGGLGFVWDFDYGNTDKVFVDVEDNATEITRRYAFWAGHGNDKMQHCNICKQRCRTEPGCTHFNAAAEPLPVPAEVYPPPPLGKNQIMCVLLSNATGLVKGKIPSPLRKVVAGLPPAEPTHFYLGSLYGVVTKKNDAFKFKSDSCDRNPARTSVVPGKPSFIFSVAITKPSTDTGADVHVVDYAAVMGQPYNTDEASNEICKMGGGSGDGGVGKVVRLPHKGRWLNISENLARRGKHCPKGGLHNKYCYPPTERQGTLPFLTRMNRTAPPIDFVGYVMGSPDNGLGLEYKHLRADGDVPFYYWQPYSCNYHHFSTAELRSCLERKGITKFIVEGDSLMTGGGTGWVTTFRELLGHVHNTTEFPTTFMFKSGGAEEDPVFTFAGLSSDQTHNLFKMKPVAGEHADKDSDVYRNYAKHKAEEFRKFSEQFSWTGGKCPDVVVINFWLNHKMFLQNMTDLHASISHEAFETDRILESLQCPNGRPRMYYLTPVQMISERQLHLTTERSVAVVEWMRETLTPRGWVELDYQRLATARLFDSTCAEDGLHPAHNVRVNLAQAFANHLCFGDR